MQRVGTLFLIYLFLLACISWIPAPYRMKELFSTGSGFNMTALEETPQAKQEDAAEAAPSEPQLKWCDYSDESGDYSEWVDISTPC